MWYWWRLNARCQMVGGCSSDHPRQIVYPHPTPSPQRKLGPSFHQYNNQREASLVLLMSIIKCTGLRYIIRFRFDNLNYSHPLPPHTKSSISTLSAAASFFNVPTPPVLWPASIAAIMASETLERLASVSCVSPRYPRQIFVKHYTPEQIDYAGISKTNSPSISRGS
jgi:hypothetical protein